MSITIIVVANACTDQTADRVRDMVDLASSAGMTLKVFETPSGGKAQAINLAERSCEGGCRIYLDADVVCEPGMIGAIADALDVPEPRYVSGQIKPVTRGYFFAHSYGFVWRNLPFVKDGVCGCGLYAVNPAGRKRWDAFPLIHSDDKFVRLQFTPDERFKVDIAYQWPLPTTLWALIAVRSRWCRGNAELARDFTHLHVNDHKRRIEPIWALKFVIRYPIKCAVFLFVFAAAKLRARFYSDSTTAKWERSR